MFVSRFVEAAFQKAISLVFVSLLVTASFAQNATPPSTQASMPPLTPLPQAPAPQNNAHPYSDQNYAKPSSPFPNVLAPYKVRNVPPPNLTNSARTDQLFRDGKMYLSINDAVAMALENNLDIVIQRYNLSIADTDVLRTKSGVFARGVNQGVVTGTPGGPSGTSAGGTGASATGATGTGAGGTQIGVGGAGAGVGGLVGSTLGGGPPLSSYDPILTGTIQGERASYAAVEHFLHRRPADHRCKIRILYNFGYTQAICHGHLRQRLRLTTTASPPMCFSTW